MIFFCRVDDLLTFVKNFFKRAIFSFYLFSNESLVRSHLEHRSISFSPQSSVRHI